MARQTSILQIFVASPADVSEERELMESVIAELNQIWSNTLGISYELLKWETNVRPAFSTDPQAAINSQIKNTYDVFIGIFWGRLGTETPRAISGSIEEFENALARNKTTKGTPEIMIYFKDAPIPPSKIDTEQLQRVLDFKKSLPENGGLYSTFEDQAGFENSLRAHLSAVAQNFSSKKNILSDFNSYGIANSSMETTSELDEDDYGYIDYFEIHEARQHEMISAISLINEATIRIGEQISQRTADIREGTNIDSKEARRILKRIADDMNSYAETMKYQLAILSASRGIAFNALTNALALQGYSSEKDHDLALLRDRLAELIKGTGTAKKGMIGMKLSTIELPRISKEINKAKRAVVNEIDVFLSEIESVRSTVANIIESIDKMRSNGNNSE